MPSVLNEIAYLRRLSGLHAQLSLECEGHCSSCDDFMVPTTIVALYSAY